MNISPLDVLTGVELMRFAVLMMGELDVIKKIRRWS